MRHEIRQLRLERKRAAAAVHRPQLPSSASTPPRTPRHTSPVTSHSSSRQGSSVSPRKRVDSVEAPQVQARHAPALPRRHASPQGRPPKPSPRP